MHAVMVHDLLVDILARLMLLSVQQTVRRTCRYQMCVYATLKAIEMLIFYILHIPYVLVSSCHA